MRQCDSKASAGKSLRTHHHKQHQQRCKPRVNVDQLTHGVCRRKSLVASQGKKRLTLQNKKKRYENIKRRLNRPQSQHAANQKKVEWVHPTTIRQNNEKQNKKPKRGTTSAHTLIAPVKQNTHTGRERERGRPLNAIKTKQKQLRCSAHAARQDGSGACGAKESTNGPAWVCMQYIQWAHYVCASWDEVRARVHARGHTQRVSERRVCVRAVHGSLSLTLTRPPPQQQPHTQQEEEAKEGRWFRRPRCCRRCHQTPPYRLFWLWRLLLLLGFLHSERPRSPWFLMRLQDRESY
ncbi:hypothetical protein ECC02_010617 [Trypanosoma cruzi]|uniref:Uncharacterized protein n=1 Tax=Trypanosoma cruzi TaxID=5693 RepID=A0A7J6XRE8_TRYCR|nr:hypothetical protein ECC02_010617 [Trypanosoma cruzi]